MIMNKDYSFNKYRWLWLLALLVLLPIGSRAQTSQHVICIEKTNGNVIRIPVTADGPKINIDPYSFSMSLNGNVEYIEFGDIAKMYAEKSVTGIKTPAKNAITLETESDGTIVLSGLKNKCDVQLFDVSGKLLRKVHASGNVVRISLSSYSRGTYIVKTSNSETFKFLKR